MENKNNLPEYIKGIPTAKNRSRERMILIKDYYSKLWKQLQREGKVPADLQSHPVRVQHSPC